MKKVTLLWILLWPLAAWAQTDARTPAQWLQYQLGRYFAGSTTMQALTTPRYAAFKTDAMNVGMEGGIPYSDFQKRWSRIYNLHQPNVHSGFLVPLQDWECMNVSCEPLPLVNGEVWVGVDLVESASGAHFRCDSKLMQQNGHWRIDDVLNVAPLQQCIIGDFEGNHRQDTLWASLTNRINRQPILVDTLLDYDTLIARTVAQQPLLQLAATGLNTLLLNKTSAYVLGLLYLANIGNINGHPGDEVAVVIRAADWSPGNLFKVYSYTSKGWKLIKEVDISEEQLPAIHAGKIKPWKNQHKTDRK